MGKTGRGNKERRGKEELLKGMDREMEGEKREREKSGEGSWKASRILRSNQP